MLATNDDNESSNGGNQDNNESNNNTPCEHSYGAWSEKTTASCTASGTKERVCSKCSKKETEIIAVLGHTTTTGVCTRCNERIGWTAEELQSIVQIHDVYVDDINSADGVDMRISWTNTSNKTIKYIHFYVVPYNAVGDQMYCDIRDYSRFDAYVTGPCEPGHEGYYKIGDIYYGNLWETVWYNSSIRTIELVGMKIIYMDGTTIDIGENDVSKAFVPFSPLKEGYDMDEAFIEYYAEDKRHRFFWAIDYLGVSVRPDVNIDVRIVNSNNVEVFYGEYYAKSANYTEINMYGVNKWMMATSMYDNEIKLGNTSTGTLYYHIWSDDGEIDLGERSLAIDNLPVGNNELSFELNEDGQSYSVTGIGTYLSSDLVIPSTYNSKPVTGISDYAFEYNNTITSVTIPDSVKNLGSGVFYGCSNLANVSLGKGISGIYGDVFAYCTSLKSISVPKDHNKYKSVDGNLYNKQGVLIQYAAGKSEKSFVIPDDVKEIGQCAFYGAYSLETITIGANVESISGTPFYECTALKNFIVSDKNQNYKSVNGNLYTKDGKTLVKYAIGKTDSSFSIPNGIINIGECAFESSSFLTEIIIPNGVSYIGYYAFNCAYALESVTIPTSVTYIDFGAFIICNSLASINFNGTKAQWNAIEKGEYWDEYTENYTVYCTNGNIAKAN